MTPTVQAIAWTLIHFCWQAAAIAAVYRALSLVTARCTSSTRYVLALASLLLMLAAAVGTFGYEMQNLSPSSPNLARATANALPTYNFSPVKTAGSGAAPFAPGLPDSPHAIAGLASLPPLPEAALRFIDGLWLLGVLVLSLRSLGGWWFIQRLRASAQVEPPIAVRANFRRIAHSLGLRRPVLLRVSKSIASPVTVGAMKAIVLLPLSAITSLGPDELEVVLAHELAHVRRADFAWNLVQTFIETLFFFHPAVWWMGSRIRHERELCCDDMALTVCPNPVVYANALFQLEKQRTRPGRLAMALDGHQPGQTLKLRIARILGDPVTEAAHRGPFSLAAAAAAIVVLLLPVPQVMASFKPSPALVQAPAATAAPSTAPIVAASVSAQAEPSASPVRSTASATPSPAPEPPVAENDSEPQDTPSHTEGHSSYIDRMKAAGYDVDLDKFIAMKVQDITPEYAQQMNQLGFGKLSADDLIACKVQGVTPEVIAKLKQDGLEVKDVHQAISYRIFNVTPEFVAGMKAAGFANLTSEQLLSMRVQDVTPEYAKSIAQQFQGATAEDVVKTRIFNIDAEFIARAKKLGFNDLSIEKLVKLRVSGILDDESAK